MQLRAVKDIFHKELFPQYPKGEIDSFFSLCIEHFLGLGQFTLVMQPGYTLTHEEETPLFQALSRLKTNEPIQYILGKAYFRDLILSVNEHTLIPRPETEELVQWVVDGVRHATVNDIKILDIGTGSGCIAIALAKELSNAQVFALDTAPGALELAQQNAQENKVKVNFMEADVFHMKWDMEFDIIVSNPPYVREMEKAQMHENVTSYEPGTALFVPDDDALRYYRAIAECAQKCLRPDGLLYLEINQYLSTETKTLFEAHLFQENRLKKDIFGNYRFLRCKK